MDQLRMQSIHFFRRSKTTAIRYKEDMISYMYTILNYLRVVRQWTWHMRQARIKSSWSTLHKSINLLFLAVQIFENFLLLMWWLCQSRQAGLRVWNRKMPLKHFVIPWALNLFMTSDLINQEYMTDRYGLQSSFGAFGWPWKLPGRQNSGDVIWEHHISKDFGFQRTNWKRSYEVNFWNFAFSR